VLEEATQQDVVEVVNPAQLLDLEVLVKLFHQVFLE
jgi:hypothetical protein